MIEPVWTNKILVSTPKMRSDSTFDRLAKKMLKNWNDIEHFHKHVISEDDLHAGSFLGEYPSRVKYALHSLRDR